MRIIAKPPYQCREVSGHVISSAAATRYRMRSRKGLDLPPQLKGRFTNGGAHLALRHLGSGVP